MSKKSGSFRVGKVKVHLRGQVWYLCYYEQGQRRRPRVGANQAAARQLAAQINAQLAIGAPAALSFEPIDVTQLRERWLEQHEQVLRSSVQTINRYRTATEHLVRFMEHCPVRRTSQFQASHAERFAGYLRSIRVAPNGHEHSAKRPLMDKGIRYIMECCRAMFNYAARRRHLPPYTENPFSTLDIKRIPAEECRPIELFTADQERAFFQACDDWQFPLFLTLMLTGLRSGELCHLLLPEDLDLEGQLLRVRNKPRLGWKVKTRNERDIPLVPVLAEVLRIHLAGRRAGPVFSRRRWQRRQCGLDMSSTSALEKELGQRFVKREMDAGQTISRHELLRMAHRFWQDIGAIKEDRVRTEFMRLTKKIGLAGSTAPKVLRHHFATALQEGGMDPLIRNELMGHVGVQNRSAGHGLAMTAVYTHTRPETRRQQLESALSGRVATEIAKEWVIRKERGLANG